MPESMGRRLRSGTTEPLRNAGWRSLSPPDAELAACWRERTVSLNGPARLGVLEPAIGVWRVPQNALRGRRNE